MQEEEEEEEGNTAVVQHVRVTPARLLNFCSHKVIVYGCFSVVKHKAVWHFASRSFVILVNVCAQKIKMEKEF